MKQQTNDQAHRHTMTDNCNKNVEAGFSAAPCSAIRGVPKGCQEILGYILDVFDGSAWITQDGQVTDKWHERGIWPTPEAAAEMMQRCLSPTKLSDRRHERHYCN